MRKKPVYNALPNYAVSPGDHIQEWLEDHDVNAAELSRRLNTTPKHVSELLSGKAPLSASTALGLERVTGIPARMWNSFEAGYREDLARLAEEKDLETQYDRARKFPLSFLRKIGYLTAPVWDKPGIVRQVLEILGIGHLDAFESTWVNPKVSYRKTQVKNVKRHEHAIWMALGELNASTDDLPEYNRAGLEQRLPEIRALTAQPDPADSLKKVEALLREVGVAFTIIPPVPNFGVYGATRWIGQNPVVQLSLRGRYDDQLWFTLFHELGHVLLHDHKTAFLQGVESQEEDEADEFATKILIPEEYQPLIPRGRNIAAVKNLAEDLGIAPSIVLGQAQRLTQDYKWGHDLRIKLDWEY